MVNEFAHVAFHMKARTFWCWQSCGRKDSARPSSIGKECEWGGVLAVPHSQEPDTDVVRDGAQEKLWKEEFQVGALQGRRCLSCELDRVMEISDLEIAERIVPSLGR